MASNGPTFELAHFAWGAPDRLELSGTFSGLPEMPVEDPTLVINGADGVHRLPVVPAALSGPPIDGGRWDAVFAWQEAPVAFEDAKLELGAVVVELPQPTPTRTPARRQALKVIPGPRQEQGNTGQAPQRANGPRRAAVVPARGVQRLRVQAELLATQEALRRAQTDLQRTQEELSRMRDDLASERQLRRADTERFEQGLAAMRDAAAQALTAEQSSAQQLAAKLRDARGTIETKEAALRELGERLETAAAKQAEAESQARAEVGALRERLAALERAGQEADQLRAELDATRTQTDEARTQLDSARSAVEEARSDAERLLGRLSRLRHAAGNRG